MRCLISRFWWRHGSRGRCCQVVCLLYTVAQKKRANLLFALLVKHKLILIKIGRQFLEEPLNGTTKKGLSSLKMCASSLALPWEVLSDILSCQRNTRMHILVNNLIATNTTGSYCLENRRTCSKSYHLYRLAQNVCLQHRNKHVDAGATSLRPHIWRTA